MYAGFKRIGVYRALREFYSPVEIVGYRLFYLCISRIRPMRRLFNCYLKMIGHYESVAIYDALLHKVKTPRISNFGAVAPKKQETRIRIDVTDT